ncbi:hypothetical protein V6N13_109991 [Hibiscus sabdariffa]
MWICMFPTGLALAIEKKSRRIEISLYCPSRAIESFFTCMDNVRYLPKSMNLKRADMLVSAQARTPSRWRSKKAYVEIFLKTPKFDG